MPQASRPSNASAPATGSAALLRLPVAQLKLGMFVADLDRPWSKTPFLLEGLLLEREADLATITRLCREVSIDLSRSTCTEVPSPGAEPVAPASAHLQAADAWTDISSSKTAHAAAQPRQRLPEPDTFDRNEEVVEYPPITRQPIAWLRIVFRQMLESYLRRGDARPVGELTAGQRVDFGRRVTAVKGQASMWSLLARMLRELRSAAGAHSPSAAAAQRPGQQVSEHAPDLTLDTRPGLWQMLTEIFSRRRPDAAKVSDFFATDDLSRAHRPRVANARGHGSARHRLPLRTLLWRVILKMLGLGRRQGEQTGDIALSTPSESIANERDVSAAERADAELQVKHFEEQLPHVAVRLRQGIRAMHATYQRAAQGLPLPLEILDPVVTQIVDDVLRNKDAILWLSRLQSHDQAAHARGLQAAVYMAHLGSHLGLPRDDLQPLALAGALLDIGKMRVSQEILRKPGLLDEDEMRQARLHVQAAVQLLDASGGVDYRVREAIGRHHEREDGSGYPGRMFGEAIGLHGRIAGIVDTFLALSSTRPHAPPQPIDDCMRILLKGCGTLFHTPLVDHFIQMVGVYPVGSLVQLSTGEIAAVLSHNRARRLRPRVLLMIGSDGLPFSRPAPLDLLYRPRDPAGEEIRIVRGLPVGSGGIKAADLFVATVPR